MTQAKKTLTVADFKKAVAAFVKQPNFDWLLNFINLDDVVAFNSENRYVDFAWDLPQANIDALMKYPYLDVVNSAFVTRCEMVIVASDGSFLFRSEKLSIGERVRGKIDGKPIAFEWMRLEQESATKPRFLAIATYQPLVYRKEDGSCGAKIEVYEGQHSHLILSYIRKFEIDCVRRAACSQL